jgi:hypothetical protein
MCVILFAGSSSNGVVSDKGVGMVKDDSSVSVSLHTVSSSLIRSSST